MGIGHFSSRLRRALGAAVLLLACGPGSAAHGSVAGTPEQQYREGLARMKGQAGPVDPDAAFERFSQAAAAGHAPARFELAKFYDGSIGPRFERATSLRLLEQSAAASYLQAQEKLAFIYLNGQPGMAARDTAQAFRWFDAAHLQGSAIAGCMLGDFHREGWGTARDERRAVALYQRAARRPSACAPRAQFALYQAYLQGSGVAADLKQATAWLQKSARGGHAQAQNTLGRNYYAGRGLPQDRALGKHWMLKSREGAFPHDDEQDDAHEHAHGHDHSGHASHTAPARSPRGPLQLPKP